MALRPVILDNFNLGGIADSKYMGLPNSVTKLIGLDVHSKPGLVKVQQKLTKVVAANAPDEFCKATVRSSNGRTYFFSATSGKIWEEDGGVYVLADTTVPTTGTAFCLGAIEYGGFIYWATQNYLHRIPVARADGSSSWGTYVEMNWEELYIDAQPLQFNTRVLKLNGVNKYVSVGSSTLTRANVFTFSAWVKVDSDSSNTNRYTIWGNDDTASEFQLELGGSDADHNINRVAALIDGTYIAETDNHAFVTGEWFHLVYTRTATGANHHMYINGKEVGLLTNSTTAYTDNACVKLIGARTVATQLFPGEVSQIRIWDVALSAANVLLLHDGEYENTTDLIAEYLLNGIADDTSSGSNDGTLQNSSDFVYSSAFIPHSYALTTGIVESSGNMKVFQPREDGLTQIAIPVMAIGSGDWTFIIHDPDDTLVSTTTVVNGSMAVGFNIINITDATLEPGVEYHLHVYSSVADGTIEVANSGNLEDVLFYSYDDADSEFHPMIIQNKVLYIGDRNYIHQVEQNVSNGVHTFSLKALDFAKPLRAKCLGRFGTDLVIGTYVDDNVTSTEILRWNGWSVSFSVSDTVPEQGVNAFLDSDNQLFVNAGLNGRLYYYDGQVLKLLRDVPGDYSDTAQAVVHPDATAYFHGLSLFGLSNSTGNPAEEGVYSWGSRNSNYPSILSLDYPISQRSGSDFVLTDVEIGSILVVGDDLYVTWRDNDAAVSGLDKLDYSNKLNGAYIQTRPADLGRILLNSFEQYYLSYASLPASTDLTLEHAVNLGAFNALTTVDDTKRLRKWGNTTVIQQLIELKAIFTCTTNDSNTGPELRNITFIVNQ